MLYFWGLHLDISILNDQVDSRGESSDNQILRTLDDTTPHMDLGSKLAMTSFRIYVLQAVYPRKRLICGPVPCPACFAESFVGS